MSKALLPLFLFCACWSAQAQLSLSMHTRVGGALDFASSNEIGLNVDLDKKNYASARIAMTRYTDWFSGDVNRPQISPILGLGKVFSLTQRIALGGELDLRWNDRATQGPGLGPVALILFAPIRLSPNWKLQVSTGIPYHAGIGAVYRL